MKRLQKKKLKEKEHTHTHTPSQTLEYIRVGITYNLRSTRVYIAKENTRVWRSTKIRENIANVHTVNGVLFSFGFFFFSHSPLLNVVF